jgi:hypothetical protein
LLGADLHPADLPQAIGLSPKRLQNTISRVRSARAKVLVQSIGKRHVLEFHSQHAAKNPAPRKTDFQWPLWSSSILF